MTETELSIDQLLLTALEHARDGVVVTDISTPKNAIVYANAAFLAMTGYERDKLLDKGTRFLMGSRTRPSAAALFRKALNTGSRALVTVSTVKADGNEFWNEISMAPVREADGSIRHFIGICRDVSERIAAQEALIATEMRLESSEESDHLPTFDPITNLYNRHYVEEYAEREWLLLQRQQRPLTLFLIGLEGLEMLARQRGATAVNTLLSRIAESLRNVFRRGMDLVARYDSNHFLVAASGLSWDEASPMAEHARQVLAAVLPADCGIVPHVVAVTAVPETHLSVDDMIQRACQELEQAREGGEPVRVTALD
ncbi:PAS domain-containing protein [Hahella sp. SMD15-11]|uniref:PAS domain-containing protein n=1 Tax=Thermohahella caldifontis TaxID=3142973 RepID=A0AB39UUQ2_9GAMM